MRAPKRTVLLFLVLVAVAVAALIVVRRLSPESQDIAQAKRILEQSLVAPSTVRYQSAELVLVRDNRRIVHIVCDAQNEFGAMLRREVCVSFQSTAGRYAWIPAGAVIPCQLPLNDKVREVI